MTHFAIPLDIEPNIYLLLTKSAHAAIRILKQAVNFAFKEREGERKIPFSVKVGRSACRSLARIELIKFYTPHAYYR